VRAPGRRRERKGQARGPAGKGWISRGYILPGSFRTTA
jgi:hypothetical protein